MTREPYLPTTTTAAATAAASGIHRRRRRQRVNHKLAGSAVENTVADAVLAGRAGGGSRDGGDRHTARSICEVLALNNVHLSGKWSVGDDGVLNVAAIGGALDDAVGIVGRARLRHRGGAGAHVRWRPVPEHGASPAVGKLNGVQHADVHGPPIHRVRAAHVDAIRRGRTQLDVPAAHQEEGGHVNGRGRGIRAQRESKT
jgi:hypothetical protein